MAQKLLKPKKRKIVPFVTGRDRTPTVPDSPNGRAASMRPPRKVVLIGTYAGDQLKEWPGYYPYPLYGDDKIDPEYCKKVNELWLFKGMKEPRYFAAECLGVKTRDELKALGYPAKGKGHGDGTYLIFKIEKTYAPANASAALAASVESVIIRTKDFAKRSPKVAKQLKAYLESPDRNDPALANQLPSIVTKLPPQVLRVCEAAVQMDFFIQLGDAVKPDVPFPSIENPKFTFIDLFAGIGGFRLAMQAYGGQCVFSSEWDDAAKKTYCANYGDTPYGDITKQEVKDLIPDQFDVLCAGFPCQPFSLAGVSARKALNQLSGFQHPTQGTLFFDIVQIVHKHKPKVLFLENVRNLMAHDGGQTFRVIKDSIEAEGYSFNPMVIDASPLVPQKRLRCYMVCVRGNGKFVFPKIEGPSKKLKTILDPNPSPSYTISDNLWAGHQRRTRRNIARGTGFTAFTADVEKPAHTLVARYYKDGKECLIPQEGKNPRLLTPRECARLQGFPESFVLPRSRSVAYKQMGNSVAVPVLKCITECIYNQILKGA